MRWFEIERLMETSSAGVSCAGNIATMSGNNDKSSDGAIGAGFDPNGDWGIYANKKPKIKSKKKPNVIRRQI
jgi:hypothetical protein